ncbi:MAG: PilZ domain-containing protein [Desulfobulbaceae bacterium]|nr:PilZ domain-containing protein [Desulfobulbaceae bacterium]
MNSLEPIPILQRNFIRYRINECALAIFNNAIPFHIIDISSNGLSFRYIGNEKWFDDPLSLDIVYDNLLLKKIPVKTVSDQPITNDFIQTRRHSVQFVNLSQEEIEKINCFIAGCLK